jgi:hypothetical protein
MCNDVVTSHTATIVSERHIATWLERGTDCNHRKDRWLGLLLSVLDAVRTHPTIAKMTGAY